MNGAFVLETGNAVNDDMIEIRTLHKSFDHVHAVRGVDLTVRPGEVVVIIGPSGSGKSTVLRCINHLETPTSRRHLD